MRNQDEAWMHAACLTIAETGQKWGEGIHPSPAMRAVFKLRAERDLLRERERELVEALDLACHWAKHNGFGEGMMAEAPWLDKAKAILAESDSFNCQAETKPCQRWCGANPCLKPD